MLFNSYQFLIFFTLVVAAYYALPHSWRWLLLLGSSCYFYMSFIPVYILILLVTILIDYFAAILIERTQGPRRKAYLIVSIAATCLVLFVFKYFNFFNANMAQLAAFLHWNYPIVNLSIILPIGLSFHTFQSLSYVIEVYRGHQKAERNFGIYALYVMFFPQLVAGPIERPQNLLHQFYERHTFDYQRVTDGLKLMLWGFFKKLVIADRLAVLVNTVYDAPGDFPGIARLIATVFFAFQIYCDFSGYSDIAIGAAQVLGFKLMTNFNRPYFAKSIAEFWKRWHISLSTWFKDYLYIPLGGNRVSVPKLYANLMITFLISGLWHGANWTYVIWGGLNGAYLVGSIATQNIRRALGEWSGLYAHRTLHRWVSVGVTFSLITLAWIFFRAENLADAWVVLRGIAHAVGQVVTFDRSLLKDLAGLSKWGLTTFDVGIACVTIGIMEGAHWLQRHGGLRARLSTQPLVVRWAAYYAVIFSVIVLGYSGHHSQFIYFQF